MIAIRSGGLGCLTAAFALALAASGCGPSEGASAIATPAPQAFAPAIPVPQQPQQPQPQAPAPKAQSPAQQQRVKALIQQVDEAYAAGQADYKKGDLLAARRDFDRAVDLMLSSGIDIKSTPELQDEFDRVVDQINGLEMEALRQGNGFTPKTEDTPAEAAEEVTFVVDPNIVAKASADLATTKSDLPLVVNDYVAAYINFFANTTKGHNTLLHAFQRAGRYRQMIQRVMSEEGVPQDLIYLAVAESGFQPRAVNRKSRAGGMWQFMPRGNYGLERNSYVDERFDPEKSTRAYARYMKYIYAQLGDWYLSMAGYDWGTGNVQRAVQKTGYADFWELYKRNNLPGETKNYVPEILAAIIIANHPTQYGFDEITLDPPVLTDTVTINYSADLRLVSDIVGAPVDELIALNPSLLRMVTPPDTEFDLHLPAGTAAQFQERIAAIPVSSATHGVIARSRQTTPLPPSPIPTVSPSRRWPMRTSSSQLRSWPASKRWSSRFPPVLPLRPMRSTTPHVAAIPWSLLPTGSASPSRSFAVGTSWRLQESVLNRGAGSMLPSPPSFGPAPAELAAAPMRRPLPREVLK